MRKLMIGLSVVVAIAATGCAGSGGDAPSHETAKSAASNIVYSKDDRSSLCFGSVTSMTYGGYGVVSITNVPCEKVKHLLVK